MSVKSFNFRARARTIEHLGKGQIADCPTAVSELWKNAYDAYARNVELFTVDADYPCGALIDNGCGMSPKQIIDNWLIVGTESKSKKKVLPEEDRFGIPIRQTQGEKGIGRLSAAFLANVTFLVTKKINGSFTSLLVDWRLFENPYLSFEDISIPYLEFDTVDEITIAFDLLKEELIKNVEFENTDSIKQRAWDRFSDDELEESNSRNIITTQNQILYFCLNSVLDERAITPWKEILNKFSGKDGGQHGTALFLLDLRRDLSLLTNQGDLAKDNQELATIEKDLVDTLRAFTNPYVEKDESFSYRLYRIKKTSETKDILREADVFNIQEFEALEHKISGEVDEKGWFRGNVIAFGQDKGEVSIPPNININSKGGVGSFKFQIGAFEYNPNLSSLDVNEIETLITKAKKYSGLLIFRDNLRVLPYGRVDSDFFKIEERRSTHAGRFYWSNRRIFGYIGISHEHNKELKDKSGREGFISNQASRELKTLVEDILITLADRYFGSKSEERQELLLLAKKNKELRKDAQTQARKASQKSFKEALKSQSPKLDDSLDLARTLKNNLENVDKLSADELQDIDQKLSKLELIRTEIKTPTKPPKLGIYEEKYREYRDKYNEFSAYVIQLKTVINKMESELNKLAPQQTAKKLFDKNQSVLNSKLNKYLSAIEAKIDGLHSIWKKDISEDRSSYYSQAINIVEGVEDSSHLENALNNLDMIYLELVETYTFKYDAILKTLEKISDGINLDSAFSISEEERTDIEEKMRTINAVAQLGISVEILSHELEEIDSLVTRGLNSLPSDVKEHPGFKLAYDSHKALTSQIRFLSPLKNFWLSNSSNHYG